jgi:toxin ParE1/3/4
VAAVETTARQLARMPGMGTPWESDKPGLAGMRFFPVTKFRNHLLFYRPIESGIELVRVLHGARDLDALLDEDEA